MCAAACLGGPRSHKRGSTPDNRDEVLKKLRSRGEPGTRDDASPRSFAFEEKRQPHSTNAIMRWTHPHQRLPPQQQQQQQQVAPHLQQQLRQQEQQQQQQGLRQQTPKGRPGDPVQGDNPAVYTLCKESPRRRDPLTPSTSPHARSSTATLEVLNVTLRLRREVGKRRAPPPLLKDAETPTRCKRRRSDDENDENGDDMVSWVNHQGLSHLSCHLSPALLVSDDKRHTESMEVDDGYSSPPGADQSSEAAVYAYPPFNKDSGKLPNTGLDANDIVMTRTLIAASPKRIGMARSEGDPAHPASALLSNSKVVPKESLDGDDKHKLEVDKDSLKRGILEFLNKSYTISDLSHGGVLASSPPGYSATSYAAPPAASPLPHRPLPFPPPAPSVNITAPSEISLAQEIQSSSLTLPNRDHLSSLTLANSDVLSPVKRTTVTQTFSQSIHKASKASEAGVHSEKPCCSVRSSDCGDKLSQSLRKCDGSLLRRSPLEVPDEGRMLEDAAGGFLLFLDEDLRILFVSENVTEHLGHAQAHLIGRKVERYVHPKDFPELLKIMSDSKSKEAGDCQELTRRTFYLGMKYSFQKAGSRCKNTGHTLVQWNAKLRVRKLKTSLGVHVKGVVALCRPVRTGSVLEVRLDGNMFISRHDLAFQFVYCDSRSVSLIGYEPSELIGRTAYHFHCPSDVILCKLCHKRLMVKGSSTSGYYRFLARTGVWIWLFTHATVVYETTRKPQYIVCRNYVVSPEEAEAALAKEKKDYEKMKCLGFSMETEMPLKEIPNPAYSPTLGSYMQPPLLDTEALLKRLLRKESDEASSSSFMELDSLKYGKHTSKENSWVNPTSPVKRRVDSEREEKSFQEAEMTLEEGNGLIKDGCPTEMDQDVMDLDITELEESLNVHEMSPDSSSSSRDDEFDFVANNITNMFGIKLAPSDMREDISPRPCTCEAKTFSNLDQPRRYQIPISSSSQPFSASQPVNSLSGAFNTETDVLSKHRLAGPPHKHAKTVPRTTKASTLPMPVKGRVSLLPLRPHTQDHRLSYDGLSAAVPQPSATVHYQVKVQSSSQLNQHPPTQTQMSGEVTPPAVTSESRWDLLPSRISNQRTNHISHLVNSRAPHHQMTARVTSQHGANSHEQSSVSSFEKHLTPAFQSSKLALSTTHIQQPFAESGQGEINHPMTSDSSISFSFPHSQQTDKGCGHRKSSVNLSASVPNDCSGSDTDLLAGLLTGDKFQSDAWQDIATASDRQALPDFPLTRTTISSQGDVFSSNNSRSGLHGSSLLGSVGDTDSLENMSVSTQSFQDYLESSPVVDIFSRDLQSKDGMQSGNGNSELLSENLLNQSNFLLDGGHVDFLTHRQGSGNSHVSATFSEQSELVGKMDKFSVAGMDTILSGADAIQMNKDAGTKVQSASEGISSQMAFTSDIQDACAVLTNGNFDPFLSQSLANGITPFHGIEEMDEDLSSTATSLNSVLAGTPAPPLTIPVSGSKSPFFSDEPGPLSTAESASLLSYDPFISMAPSCLGDKQRAVVDTLANVIPQSSRLRASLEDAMDTSPSQKENQTQSSPISRHPMTSESVSFTADDSSPSRQSLLRTLLDKGEVLHGPLTHAEWMLEQALLKKSVKKAKVAAPLGNLKQNGKVGTFKNTGRVSTELPLPRSPLGGMRNRKGSIELPRPSVELPLPSSALSFTPSPGPASTNLNASPLLQQSEPELNSTLLSTGVPDELSLPEDLLDLAMEYCGSLGQDQSEAIISDLNAAQVWEDHLDSLITSLGQTKSNTSLASGKTQHGISSQNSGATSKIMPLPSKITNAPRANQHSSMQPKPKSLSLPAVTTSSQVKSFPLHRDIMSSFLKNKSSQQGKPTSQPLPFILKSTAESKEHHSTSQMSAPKVKMSLLRAAVTSPDMDKLIQQIPRGHIQKSSGFATKKPSEDQDLMITKVVGLQKSPVSVTTGSCQTASLLSKQSNHYQTFKVPSSKIPGKPSLKVVSPGGGHPVSEDRESSSSPRNITLSDHIYTSSVSINTPESPLSTSPSFNAPFTLRSPNPGPQSPRPLSSPYPAPRISRVTHRGSQSNCRNRTSISPSSSSSSSPTQFSGAQSSPPMSPRAGRTMNSDSSSTEPISVMIMRKENHRSRRSKSIATQTDNQPGEVYPQFERSSMDVILAPSSRFTSARPSVPPSAAFTVTASPSPVLSMSPSVPGIATGTESPSMSELEKCLRGCRSGSAEENSPSSSEDTVTRGSRAAPFLQRLLTGELNEDKYQLLDRQLREEEGRRGSESRSGSELNSFL